MIRQDDLALLTGQTISHYEILEKLGEGGMGEVYKARDTRLDRHVAIKVLPAADVADPARKARFLQEAKPPPPSTIQASSTSTTSPRTAARTSSPWSTWPARPSTS